MPTYKVLDALAKHGANRTGVIQNHINDALTWKGPESQARIMLTAVLNELTLRTEKRGYARARKFWEDARSEPKYDALKPWLAQSEIDNFRNLLSRVTRRGMSDDNGKRSFDMFEAAILIEILIEKDEDEANEVLKTLTPYHLHIWKWTSEILYTGNLLPPPKLPVTTGIDGVSAPASSDPPAEPAAPGIWDIAVSALRKRDVECPYWNDVFRKPNIKGEACFILFRNSLKQKGLIVQTFLSIQKRNPGEHTFVHVYKFRDHSGASTGDRRMSRGFVMPTDQALVLIGVQDADPDPEEGALNVDLSRPAEIIMLSAARLKAAPQRFRGATITSNEDNKLLVSRIAVRRTVLLKHEIADTATYPRHELEGRLKEIAIKEVEVAEEIARQRFEAKNPGKAYEPKSEEDIKKLVTTACAAVPAEAADILHEANNLSYLDVPDFQNPDDPKSTISGDIMYTGIYDSIAKLFSKDDKPLQDLSGRAFERALHIQMRSLDAD